MYMDVQILSVLIRIRSDRHRFSRSGYVPYPFQHKVKINYTFHKNLNILSKVTGFRIRIRIRINLSCWIRIRIQEGKNDPQK
jgi:hypothetical protein